MQDSILLDIAQESKRTPAQVLVRWSIQKGFIPVVKSDTPSRIGALSVSQENERQEESHTDSVFNLLQHVLCMLFHQKL